MYTLIHGCLGQGENSACPRNFEKKIIHRKAILVRVKSKSSQRRVAFWVGSASVSASDEYVSVMSGF